MYGELFDPKDVPASLRDCFEEVETACGAPWRRVVERTGRLIPSGPNQIAIKPKGQNRHAYDGPLSERGTDGYGDLPKHETRTLGWQPSCSCPPADPVPQLVCDPFGGSGTTGLVADRLGRDAVLVELNPEYAEMARKRIEQDAGTLFADPVAVEQPQQIDLFGEVAG